MFNLLMFTVLSVYPLKFAQPELPVDPGRSPLPRITRSMKNTGSGFVVDGQKFKSIKDWKDSKEYNNMKIMQGMDEYLSPIEDKTNTLNDQYNMRIIKRFNKDRTTANMNYALDSRALRGWRFYGR